jgi:hypothetical protein
MKMLIAAALAISSIAAPASAADWRVVGANDDFMDFVDVGSVTREADTTRFWLNRVLKTPDPLGTKQSRMLIQTSCAQKRYRMIAMTTYSATDTPTSIPLSRGFDYAAPDTAIWDVLDRVCNGAWPTETVPNPKAMADSVYQ